MIESTDLAKMDRLAAFVESFRLSARVLARGEPAGLSGPCLYLCGAPDSGDFCIVLRVQADGDGPQGQQVAVAIDFDNASNPLMVAIPHEVTVWLRDSPTLRLTAAAFLAEVQGRRCGRVAALNRLAEVIVLMMLRQVIDTGASRAGLYAALAHPSLHRALVSIHDQPSHAWTVQALAERAAMSRTQFMATFRRMVGTTPMAYLGSWRLTVACRHLKAGQPVKAVARRVGFSSAAAFSRAFSRAYGHAPMEIRATK